MKCLIIDDLHPSIVTLLKKSGIKSDYLPNITKVEIFERISEYEGLILRSKINIDSKLLKLASKLLFIARAGAGIETINKENLVANNIMLINAPEGNRDAVGEHTLGMLLAIFNNLVPANQEVKKGLWLREKNRGVEIKNKVIGLIGYGNMGKSFAKCLSGFDCKVIAYDKKNRSYKNRYAKQVSLATLVKETDVLSLHIPLLPENKGLISLSFLESFKKNIYLINTARGEIITLETIKKGLESGKLLGVALDVFENENFDSLTVKQKELMTYLSKKDNVLFSPHVAGWTHESKVRIAKVLVKKIDRFLRLYLNKK